MDAPGPFGAWPTADWAFQPVRSRQSWTVFTEEATLPDRIPGAGIGLAGARRMLEEQGGTLEVANRQGGGAVFTIRLPLPLLA